ncbi:MAG TPA: tyrosine-type recombinase/integrase [Candidatus Pelethosoma merdigallinarum]|nr:tyrosine-type recombinase/integrase [Candidatus Pelethosoma merdigallinarum]
MATYHRRIKSSAGKDKTLPIKDKKLLNRVMDFLRLQIDLAKSDIKKYQAWRNYILFLLGFNSAFRAEDLLQLKVKDIEKGYFSIKENKTGKWQHFRMNKLLLDEIMEYVNYYNLKSNQYLFMGQKKKETHNGKTFDVIYPITRQNCQNVIIPKVIKGCGIDFPFGMHSLRKTFGYQWYKNGGSLITLMKMYNHEEPSVTLLYVMWDNEDIEKARESIYIGGINDRSRKK